MVVIDPSKGGKEEGIKSNNIVEKDFNLLISKYIYDRLKQLNIDTILIRENDEYIDSNERKDRIINSFGNNPKVIAIVNKLSNEGDGVEIIYALRNKDNLSKRISDNLKNSNIKVNKYYQKRSEEDTSKDYYDIQKDTENIETIIINYGNINNKEEADNLNNNYKVYAEAVIKAILEYRGLSYDKKQNIYVVQKGDNLYSISKKFNTTVEKLKQINNLSSNLLSVGQELKIPN